MPLPNDSLANADGDTDADIVEQARRDLAERDR
jgi:hypothetical protein